MFSFFNWKSVVKKLLGMDKVQALFDKAKELILEYKDLDLKGEEKKAAVDEKLINWIREHLDTKNKIVKWLIENVLIDCLPTITQNIYDLIKLFAEGITKKAEEAIEKLEDKIENFVEVQEEPTTEIEGETKE